ncbi:MAG: beta-lactamase domain protein [Nitrospira sp.]|jgi:glyoxylase-like metal-dependent hydrolase (beta-lactamase superfamily II)/ferredoxin|nr:MAG: beta-lactamase domain protein [Nitrospira sp.]
MADSRKRLDSNVTGAFFVDATCINCDACRQLAPETFSEVGEYSAVVAQPTSARERHRAYQALLACPVGSIGTETSDKAALREAMASFPLRLCGGVSYCGFNAEQSFGANSFFVEHPEGNWLVDSPRFLKHLVEAFERRGGVRYIFLTHEDDVADAARYAAHFQAMRIIHRADAEAMPDAERLVEGDEPITLARDFLAVPVPGHTAGSMALLYRERVLFTGDHLWWDPKSRTLESPRQLVQDQGALLRSIATLQSHRFEWVLAGHGDRIHLPPEEMQAQLRDLLRRRQPATISR